eukprot:223383-Ditylum_brightwellii.AAC.1
MYSYKKPGASNDVSNKENFQSNKDGLSFDGEDRALMHSCKKYGTPKYISFKKENFQNNKGGLLCDGRDRALLYSYKKPGTPKDIFN